MSRLLFGNARYHLPWQTGRGRTRSVRVLACLAEGLGIRATARVFEVAPNTVLHWLVEAAEHLRNFSAYLLCNVHVRQLQLDELYAILRDVKTGALSDDEAIQRLERSPYWVWTAMDPQSKLLLVIAVGTRTLEMAQRMVHQVVQVLAPDSVPLCLTDGLKDYGTALLTHFGSWVQPQRRRATGAMPKPRWMPLPQLLYAQVVKLYRRRRLVGVKYRVVFGTMERVQQVLSACGRKINTAFVERLNLDIRQRAGGLGTPGQYTLSGRRRLNRISWWCSRRTTTWSCPMPVCAKRLSNRSSLMARARPGCGGHVHQRWRRV